MFFFVFPNVKSTRNWENHWNWGIYLCQFSNFLTSPPAATPKVEAQNYISPKSQNIVSTLEDMKMKAREELNTMAVAEKQSLHSFMMLKQPLEMQISADQKEMDQAKLLKATAQQEKAMAEADLEGTQKESSDLNWVHALET